VKILLDENLPQKLAGALRLEGHEVESVHTLRMEGLDNGRLYSFAIENYDLCFTRDFGFAHNARQGIPPKRLRLLRVTLPQKPQDEYIVDFILAFRRTDLSRLQHGNDWP
jgi:predicted nuclease of predicted toxin-antitoxin system